MKILMFGWEFPPFNVGGLGVVCEKIVKALAFQGIAISFVLPKKVPISSSFCKMLFANKIRSLTKIRVVNSLLSAYATSKSYRDLFNKTEKQSIYSDNLIGEVKRYAIQARAVALEEDFDIIHTHDWLTYLAGIEAKKISKKPLICHVHATGFDQGGGSCDPRVYKIEKQGFEAADLIIAVSELIKNRIINHYGINPDKIRVVYNAINVEEFPKLNFIHTLQQAGKKIVIFIGRITLHKGPDYFLKAAKRVLEKDKNVIFIVVGTGDMEIQLIEQAAKLGIAKNVIFTGFLREEERNQIFQMANLYVLPSVSEPFGLTPLESLAQGTPVLISRQSGVSEILSHCLKVDFWDTDEMANKILAVLKYPKLEKVLTENGSWEVKKFNWEKPARECVKIYKELIAQQA